ncbi:hypothetical protein OKJ48_17840 [Streptomyces kunmingensis]|uniref:Uncharacterized protein n=1 Tax=Streptomyces kunmingensis TaxID=68225 RepID=A0ABU6CBL5_9ACTN|nr:hypothetical protein [Streptomyces kunmingensis]MEB3962096.1 hypothetical protein [Streptomyces kunmingensis]
MFEYELHQARSAELIQQAEAYRLARAALKARRAARHSARQEAEGRVSTNGPRRHRAPRAA